MMTALRMESDPDLAQRSHVLLIVFLGKSRLHRPLSYRLRQWQMSRDTRQMQERRNREFWLIAAIMVELG